MLWASCLVVKMDRQKAAVRVELLVGMMDGTLVSARADCLVLQRVANLVVKKVAMKVVSMGDS